ncbi:DUF2335 domain-containing protein [Morganella morganii]|uniref:DUF2335 domain-containing protein n=1 Tax=Morganella morganii TaxID=582 RepID=UPI001CEC2836|nr:DUF2335 domain-containing protein [Morganella morganii]MCW3199659.1 DUF2335 domain-containing protein [Morganella morganii]
MDSLPGQSNHPSQHDVVSCDDGSDTEVAIQEIERVVVDNPQVLKRILDNPKAVSVIEKREFFRGPLPHPRQLKQYNDTLPGAAERIFQLTEREQAHRHNSETKALNGAISRDKRGQWMAYSLSLLILGIAAYFAYQGDKWFAGVLITGNLVALATVFSIGKRAGKEKEQPADLSEIE